MGDAICYGTDGKLQSETGSPHLWQADWDGCISNYTLSNLSVAIVICVVSVVKMLLSTGGSSVILARTARTSTKSQCNSSGSH